jgi:hypothetical protein
MTHDHDEPTATPTEQNAVWLALRIHTSDGPQPIALGQLVADTGLDRPIVRAAIRTLRRRGLLHVQRRRHANGRAAPSRYACTVPRDPADDHRRHMARLMTETPRGR